MAASKAALAMIEVDAIKDDVPCKARLDSEDKVAQVFPGGTWHNAVFRESMTGRDNEKAASFQWLDGRYYADRYGKGWALTLLSTWSFVDEHDAPVPTDEHGWYSLAPDIQDVIAGSVAAWKDSLRFPNSNAPLILK